MPAERATSPIELVWDLVFVFAVTQVTTLIAHDPSWRGLRHGLLALALLWWAWSSFVWVANAHKTDSPALRVGLLGGTLLIFVVGLALPRAFAELSLLFASAYAAVRLVHLWLYLIAEREGRVGQIIARFATTSALGMVLLVVGGFLTGNARTLLWTVAVVIDYLGPVYMTRERFRGLQNVAAGHFAERFEAFVLLCIGESILAIGAGVSAEERHISPELIIDSTIGLAIAIAMWWTYFDRIAPAARERFRQHRDPLPTAVEAYSYLHLVIVAGILLFAAGIKLVLHNPAGQPIPTVDRLEICGGVAAFLLGLTLFRHRMLAERDTTSAAAALGLLLLYGAGSALPQWAVGAIIFSLMAALCCREAVRPRPAEHADPLSSAGRHHAKGSVTSTTTSDLRTHRTASSGWVPRSVPVAPLAATRNSRRRYFARGSRIEAMPFHRADPDGLRRLGRRSTLVMTREPMTDIADRYREYIECLNTRQLERLAEWVCDELVYNGERMTRAEYQALLAADIAAIPDLFFTIDLLVVGDDHVACRLTFDCTPEREWRGLQPNGTSIAFAEHVFYAFDGGRIRQVWSLLDRPAIEAQLSA